MDRSSRSKYPIGKVLKRIKDESNKPKSVKNMLNSAGIGVGYLELNYDSEIEDELDIELDDEKNNDSDDDVVMNVEYMDAGDITLGFDWFFIVFKTYIFFLTLYINDLFYCFISYVLFFPLCI